MSNEMKRSAKWATFGAVICTAVTALVFAINYWLMGSSMAAYQIIAYPGMMVLSLFSEEINFGPKLVILLSGQYLICFATLLIYRALLALKNNNANK